MQRDTLANPLSPMWYLVTVGSIIWTTQYTSKFEDTDKKLPDTIWDYHLLISQMKWVFYVRDIVFNIRELFLDFFRHYQNNFFNQIFKYLLLSYKIHLRAESEQKDDILKDDVSFLPTYKVRGDVKRAEGKGINVSEELFKRMKMIAMISIVSKGFCDLMKESEKED